MVHSFFYELLTKRLKGFFCRIFREKRKKRSKLFLERLKSQCVSMSVLLN